MYELLVLDDGVLDFKSKSMEGAHDAYVKEIEQIEEQLEYEHQGMLKALHKAAFDFPGLAAKLRKALNKINELRAAITEEQAQVISKDHDPVTGRDKDDDMDPVQEMAAQKAAEAEDAEILALKATADGKTLERLCKRVFRKISGMTHPDKTNDKELHEVFRTAKQFMEEWNLKALEQIYKDVKHYTKVRKNNKSFQQYMREVLAKKKQQRDAALIKRAKWHSTPGYKVFANRMSSKFWRGRAYSEFVQQQLEGYQKEIDHLTDELAMRKQRSVKPSFTY